MSEPPNGLHRGLLILIAGFVGLVGGYAFHELAGLRPFVPPIMSGGASMACGDLDAYVQHVSDFSDHRRHDAIVGIHRQKTIDAVNELYDRARCQPQRDADGHETYQQFHAKVVDDVNDPGPRTALEPPRSYPLYSHGVFISPPATTVAATGTPPNPVAPTARAGRRRALVGAASSLSRRTVTALDEENQAGTPPAADPADVTPQWPCHKRPEAGEPNWKEAGPLCPE